MIIDSSTLVGTTALSGSFEITGSTLPGLHSAYDFGSASKAFGRIYSTAFSGSLTKLLDGTSFLVAGNNVSIATGSSGAVTISATVPASVVTGTGTTNYVPKWSSSSALTDSVLYDAGSAIGVGTTLVGSNKLVVAGALAVSGALEPGTDLTNDLGSNTKRWKTIYASALSGSLTRLADGTSYLVAGSNVTITTGSSGAVTIASTSALTGTGTTNYMTKWSTSTSISNSVAFDDGTNIGIGTTTSMTGRLHVSGSSTSSAQVAVLQAGVAAPSGKVLDIRNSTGSTVASIDHLGNFSGNDGSFGGNLNITGNLNVLGTQVIVDSTVVNIKDNIILVNAGPSPLSTGGIYVADTTANTTGSLIWDATTDRWRAGLVGNETNVVLTGSTDNLFNKTLTIAGSTANIISGGTVGAVGFFNSSGYLSSSAQGTSGQILQSGGSSTPTWVSFGTLLSGSSVITGSGTVNYYAKFTSGNALANGVIYDDGTNAGIGTTNPTARLYISGSTSTTQPELIVREGVPDPQLGAGIVDIQNSVGTSLLFVSGSGFVGIGTNTQNGTSTGGILHVSSSLAGNANSQLIIGSQFLGTSVNLYRAHTQVFQHADGTETMRITSVGNVGIGSSSTVSARLQISGSATTGTPTTIIKAGIPSPIGAVLDVQSSAGTTFLVVSGSGNVGINQTNPDSFFSGFNNLVVGNTSAGAGITIVASPAGASTIALARGTSSTDPYKGFLQYSHVSDAFIIGTSATEKVRVDSAGNVGIGTNNPIRKLHIVNNQPLRMGLLSEYWDFVQNTTNEWAFLSNARIYSIFMNNATGNVGIGAVSTADKFSVNGSMSVTGSLLPGTDNVYNLGAPNKRWANIYATSISGSLTGSNVLANQVVFAGTGGALTGSSLFLYDAANRRLGIGTASVGSFNARLNVYGASTSFGQATFEAQNSAGTSLLYVGDNGNIGINSNNPGARLEVVGATSTAFSTSLQCWDSSSNSLFIVRNDGRVGVATSNPAYTLEVNGSFAAVTKSFVIPHPTRPGWKLRYGSLEGPENGVYVRGYSTGVIKLPDYWSELVDEKTLTVQLTPIGRYQKLYVEKISATEIVIRNASWIDRLLRLQPSFSYVVQGSRKDATFDVEYQNSDKQR